MPGKQVKNWKQYHGLRKKGMSKTRAAKIANAGSAGGTGRHGSGHSGPRARYKRNS